MQMYRTVCVKLGHKKIFKLTVIPYAFIILRNNTAKEKPIDIVHTITAALLFIYRECHEPREPVVIEDIEGSLFYSIHRPPDAVSVSRLFLFFVRLCVQPNAAAKRYLLAV